MSSFQASRLPNTGTNSQGVKKFYEKKWVPLLGSSGFLRYITSLPQVRPQFPLDTFGLAEANRTSL